MNDSPKTLYFLAAIHLDQAGVKGLTLINLPIKTTMHNNFFRGVTLEELLEESLRDRLKQVNNVLISFKEVSGSLLQEEFQCSEDLFISLETEEKYKLFTTY